jgi:replication factor C small subunit
MSALTQKFKQSRDILLDLIINKGVSGEDIIREIYKQLYNLDVEDEKKLLLVEKLGEYEFRMTEGSNQRIQLEALLASFGLIGK